MRVLHVNHVDLQGRRFNGFDLMDDLEGRGIASRQVVLRKQSLDNRVTQIVNSPADRALHDVVRSAEQRNSMNNLLFPWGRVLPDMREFQEADLVHYHLIQSEFVSLFDLPKLFASKPSVWTFHDPWPLTGHCIHPLDCDGWLRGCTTCPDLDRRYPLTADTAGQMWRVKRDAYADARPDVIVASEFMLDMVRRSPMSSELDNVHLVPFGVRIHSFLPDGEQAQSRLLLGVPQDDFVVMIRAAPGTLKGLPYFIQAMLLRPPDRSVTVITVDGEGLATDLESTCRVLEFGWVEDPALYVRLLSACDVFVMPSEAEAFGLMAVEAMAAGRPVICFSGTALEAVTHAPDCGLAVAERDSAALREAIDLLIHRPEEARRRGEACRKAAWDSHNHEGYLERLLQVYEHVVRRHQSDLNAGTAGGGRKKS